MLASTVVMKHAVNYQLGDEPYFLEKLPYNFLYAGFIARAYPDAKIVYVKRNPLDACFAMFNHVFTWAYKFSYSLDDLADYYLAHTRLLQHCPYERETPRNLSALRRFIEHLHRRGIQFGSFCPHCLSSTSYQNADSP